MTAKKEVIEMAIQDRHSSKIYWLTIIAAVVFTVMLVAGIALYSHTQDIVFLIPAAFAAAPTAFLCVRLDQIDNALMGKRLEEQVQTKLKEAR